MNPELTNAIFALVGVFIGSLVASIGTYATLRQQHRIWKTEKLLEELRDRRNEIDELVENLGHLDINAETGLKINASNDPASRAALYKVFLRSVLTPDLDKPISTPELIPLLKKLGEERHSVDSQINELLSKESRSK